MRATLTFWTLTLGLSAALANWTMGEDQSTKIRLDLKDGGSVIGRTDLTAIHLDIDFDSLRIPLERVSRMDRVQIASQGDIFAVQLRNQDVITGQLKNSSLPLETVYGRVDPNRRFIVSMEMMNNSTSVMLPVRRNLVIHFPFDQMDNGLLVNAVGKEHAGRVQNLSLVDQGVSGRSAIFQNQSRVEIQDHADLKPDCFTFGGWVKPQAGSSGYQVLAAKTNPSSWYGGYGLIKNSGDDRHIRFFVNGYTQTVVKAELEPARWSHVIGVCDGESIQIYIDGKLRSKADIKSVRASSLGSDLHSVGLIHHVNNPLTIGSDSHHYAWCGKLDDFVFYDRPLADQEIELLYRHGCRQIRSTAATTGSGRNVSVLSTR